MHRSEFIKTIIRTGIFAMLGFTVWFSFSKRGESGQDFCSKNDVCKSCSKFKKCKLPKAEESRSHE